MREVREGGPPLGEQRNRDKGRGDKSGGREAWKNAWKGIKSVRETSVAEEERGVEKRIAWN